MNQRTILITGCSSGIGLASARALKSRGWQVFATARTAADLERLRSVEGLNAVPLELSDPSSIAACADTVLEKTGGRLTALFNNAAFGQPGAMEDLPTDALRAQFEVNVFGTLAITRAALPRLRARASPDHHSLIITMSSMLGLVSNPNQGIYAASKHALEGAFSALRMELRTQNIDVVLIQPGWIRTNLLKTALTYAPEKWLDHPVYGASLKNYFAITEEAESEQPTGAAKIAASLAGTPEDVAATVIKALESIKPRAHYPVTAMAKWMPRMPRMLATRLCDRLQTGQ